MQTYQIPPGAMSKALNAVAGKNGLQLLYDAWLTESLRSPGLVGIFSTREALDRLLIGTSLSYRFSRDGEDVSIVLAQNDSMRNDAGAEELPSIDIGAARPGDSRLRQAEPHAAEQLRHAGRVGRVGRHQDRHASHEHAGQCAGDHTEVLKDQQAITLAEALRNVSGVSVGSPGASSGFSRANGILLRGFNAGSIYRDGFRVDNVGNIDIFSSTQLGNVASIEVLKGPAAILYGLSEPGGIVNITTKGPQEQPHYSITQQIGSLALYRTTIGATGPLSADKSVLYRVDTSYENNGAPYGSFVDLTHSQNFFVVLPIIDIARKRPSGGRNAKRGGSARPRAPPQAQRSNHRRPCDTAPLLTIASKTMPSAVSPNPSMRMATAERQENRRGNKASADRGEDIGDRRAPIAHSFDDELPANVGGA